MEENSENKLLSNKLFAVSKLRKKFFRSADDMPSSKFCTNPVAKNFVDFSFQKKFTFNLAVNRFK